MVLTPAKGRGMRRKNLERKKKEKIKEWRVKYQYFLTAFISYILAVPWTSSQWTLTLCIVSYYFRCLTHFGYFPGTIENMVCERFLSPVPSISYYFWLFHISSPNCVYPMRRMARQGISKHLLIHSTFIF